VTVAVCATGLGLDGEYAGPGAERALDPRFLRGVVQPADV
jgi:hypothetical protein